MNPRCKSVESSWQVPIYIYIEKEFCGIFKTRCFLAFNCTCIRRVKDIPLSHRRCICWMKKELYQSGPAVSRVSTRERFSTKSIWNTCCTKKDFVSQRWWDLKVITYSGCIPLSPSIVLVVVMVAHHRTIAMLMPFSYHHHKDNR